ncbi:MAG: PAS domain-containing protein, partial [Methylobacter sp.]|nr:PAS domain-containing protein [Methylobacter sp.]
MSSNDQNSSIHKTSAVPPSVKTPSDIGAESSLASLRTLLTGLQTVIDQTGSYIFTKDLQGRYTYVNQKIQDLFGASYHDIVGKDDSHFFDIALSNELQINDRRVIDLGETIECEERNILKPSGNEQFFWSIKKPV